MPLQVYVRMNFPRLPGFQIVLEATACVSVLVQPNWAGTLADTVASIKINVYVYRDNLLGCLRRVEVSANPCGQNASSTLHVGQSHAARHVLRIRSRKHYHLNNSRKRCLSPMILASFWRSFETKLCYVL